MPDHQQRMTQVANSLPKVLLVDDEPFNIDLLEQELSGYDLEIYSATNGREALEAVADNPPDMMFLDLMMPEIDGFGVLEALQADDSWREIPVVIVSASNDLSNIVRGIEMGATDFLPKPFEPAVLKARLSAGLERKRMRNLEQRYLKSLQRELDIGREIQQGFLPVSIPQPEGWTLLTHFQAAREVAGDFYDVFEIGAEKIGLLVGDVTDKGVGSAMYMALYRTLLRSSMLSDTFAEDTDAEDCATPEECLLHAVRLANRYIYRFHPSPMLATLFFAVLNTETGDLCYINAGHDPPSVLREGEILHQIQPTGPIVGAIESAPYRVETLQLSQGDLLVIYSDGIPDAQNEKGERFGNTRLLELLKEKAGSPEQAFNSILESLERHARGVDPFDDVTLMIVYRNE